MLGLLVILLIIFWFAGYGPFALLADPLFTFNRVHITLWDILIFLVFVWLIDLLPSPFREIGIIIIIFWLLSTFGLLSFIAGLPSIIVILIIVALVVYLLRGV